MSIICMHIPKVSYTLKVLITGSKGKYIILNKLSAKLFSKWVTTV